MALVGLQALGVAFKKTKLCQKSVLVFDRFLTQFCLKMFHECFQGGHKMWQKFIKKLALSQFCHVFGQNVSIWQQICDKKLSE